MGMDMGQGVGVLVPPRLPWKASVASLLMPPSMNSMSDSWMGVWRGRGLAPGSSQRDGMGVGVAFGELPSMPAPRGDPWMTAGQGHPEAPRFPIPW